MTTVPVKICGITRPEDAALAARLGATWIGFVFWPRSPRAVTPATAAGILATLPPHVTGVGVFVDQPLQEVNAVADQVGLGAIQLHGAESPAVCAGCRRRVIKAARLSPDSTEAVAEEVWSGATLLLDAYDPVRFGGTGRQVDWSLAARLARTRPTILSGGLRPDTVTVAIEAVAPYGLDVSSGVEAEPGIKDPEKLRAFFAAVEDGGRAATATRRRGAEA